MKRILAAMGLVVIAVLAQPVSAQDSLVNYTLLESPPRALPKKLVLLAPQVTVREISAGGVLDIVPEWTKQANANITSGIKQLLGQRTDVSLVATPEFTPEESAQIEQYEASYWVVASAAHYVTTFGGSAWEHKRKHFDYTLGEGLDFVREKTGADAAVMVIGQDYVSSGGRKAAIVLGALLGVGMVGGQSLISIGVVDLKNGDILWMHHDQSGVKDLSDRSAVQDMLTGILDAYPGKAAKLAQR